MSRAILKRSGCVARPVVILGFIKTHVTETRAVVAFVEDGRLTEAALHELTLDLPRHQENDHASE